MIGFPGETEEDLLDTLDVVEKLDMIQLLHLFILKDRNSCC